MAHLEALALRVRSYVYKPRVTELYHVGRLVVSSCTRVSSSCATP
jgi:hypothetical protein